MGTYYPWIKVTAAGGLAGSGRASLYISAPNLTISPKPDDTLPRGRIGFPYSLQVTASGGTPPLRFIVKDASPGMTISPSGLLSGRPLSNWAYVRFDLVDATNNPLSFTLTFYADNGLRFDPPTGIQLPQGRVGTLYSARIAATGFGSGVSGSGQLPSWLSMAVDAGGVTLTGTPTAAGVHQVGIQMSDAAGGLLAAQYSLTVIGNSATPLQVETRSLPDAFLGAPYSQRVKVSGGTPPYTFKPITVIKGLTMNAATGEYSGTPTAVWDGYVYAEVTDAALNIAVDVLRFRVFSSSLKLTAPPLPAGVAGTPYAYGRTIGVEFGIQPYVLSVISGALPPGMSLSPAMVFEGSPTTPGTDSFTV
jgi:hypothetical protein